MNPVNPEIEERLLALRPADPPADLLKRLIHSEPPAPGKIRWLRLFAMPAAAAAALALFALPLLRAKHHAKPRAVAESAPAPSDLHVFVPIEETSTLIEAHNLAVIDIDPSRPIRLVRATWLDDITYARDDGRGTLRRREPRTEILSVPLDSL